MTPDLPHLMHAAISLQLRLSRSGNGFLLAIAGPSPPHARCCRPFPGEKEEEKSFAAAGHLFGFVVRGIDLLVRCLHLCETGRLYVRTEEAYWLGGGGGSYHLPLTSTPPLHHGGRPGGAFGTPGPGASEHGLISDGP